MNSDHYFTYLIKRSWRALIYRKFILYPFIKHKLKGNVLDLGCGIGDFLVACKRAVGADINPDNIKYCKSQQLIAVLLSDNQYPFINNSFDSVLLDNVIEHIANPTEMLNEISRILKYGGQLMIGVPGVKGYASDDDHKVFYTEESLKMVCLDHGFKFVHSYYMPLCKSDWLSQNMSQYCLYSLFTKT